MHTSKRLISDRPWSTKLREKYVLRNNFSSIRIRLIRIEITCRLNFHLIRYAQRDCKFLGISETSLRDRNGLRKYINGKTFCYTNFSPRFLYFHRFNFRSTMLLYNGGDSVQFYPQVCRVFCSTSSFYYFYECVLLYFI